MSHLDEGTLHALLDGELETTEVAEIQAHLGSCSACGLRLREVKEFLGEADRLIAAVELGAAAASGAEPPAGAQREAVHPPGSASPAPSRPGRRARATAPAATPRWRPASRWNEPPPVLLIPDNESAADRRQRRLRGFGWAALVVGMVGAGFLGVQMRPSRRPSSRSLAAQAAESDAVVSSGEATSRADETARASGIVGARAAKDQGRRTRRPSPWPRHQSSPGPSTTAARVGQRGEKPAGRRRPRSGWPPGASGAGEGRRQTDARRSTPSPKPRPTVAEADSAAAEDIAIGAGARRRSAGRPRSRAAPQPGGRRHRRARLPSAGAGRSVAAATSPPAASPPCRPRRPPRRRRPRRIEQRAQVYLRIGLDEASRQLGGPAHVIEGMSPMFMGLARGVVGPGRRRDAAGGAGGLPGFAGPADPARSAAAPAGPGAAAARGPLSLADRRDRDVAPRRGEPGVLRTYRPRVR